MTPMALFCSAGLLALSALAAVTGSPVPTETPGMTAELPAMAPTSRPSSLVPAHVGPRIEREILEPLRKRSRRREMFSRVRRPTETTFGTRLGHVAEGHAYFEVHGSRLDRWARTRALTQKPDASVENSARVVFHGRLRLADNRIELARPVAEGKTLAWVAAEVLIPAADAILDR